MKRFQVGGRIAAMVFLLMGLAGLTAVSPAAPNALADRVDAVAIKGKDLPAALRGSPIKSYRVLADYGQGLVTVPMQIDERDGNGLILACQGPKPDKCDLNFDPRDELLFMARDSGLRPQSTAVTGCENTALITLTDPKSGADGYAVLARCSHPPALSPKDYVRLETKPYTVVTDRYRLGWHERLTFSYDYITINDGPDILDRLRVRATIGKFGINYTFNEDDFLYRLRGYNDGPVRVAWKADNYWSLGPLGKLDIPQYLMFYPEYVFLQNRMDLTMNPALIGLDLFVEIGHDMNIDPAGGYSVCSNSTNYCLPLNKPFPDGSLKELTEKKMTWGGVPGPEGALMIHIVVDPKLHLFVKGLFTFDKNFSDPPEFIKGMMPRISFYLVDWPIVKPEKYDINFFFYMMNKFTRPEFDRFDRVVVSPLAVSVK